MKTNIFARTVASFAVAATLLGVAGSAMATEINSSDYVEPGESVIYRGFFDAEWQAMASLSGDCDSDLDLFVYDENWNLIASSDSVHCREATNWTPDWTGLFYIEVANVGDYTSSFTLNAY